MATATWVSTVTPWGGASSPQTSGSFTPTASNVIVVFGNDFGNGAATINFSGTGGTYNRINPPGNFPDLDTDTHAIGWNASCSGGAQTVTVTSAGSTGLQGWAWQYSSVQTVSGVAVNRAGPGTGAGACLGTSVTVPTGSTLLAMCVCDSAASTISSPSGTNRGSGTNNGESFCVTEYAGAGSAIQPSFTVTTGAADYTVSQILLNPPTGPNLITPVNNAQIYNDQRATFTVSATTSGGALTYQWQDNRSGSFANVTDGVGGTTATYLTEQLTTPVSGRLYQVILTDSNGSITSGPGTLFVYPWPTVTAIRPRPRHGGLNWLLNSAEWW